MGSGEEGRDRRACRLCGLPARDGEFCCAGCRSVATVLAAMPEEGRAAAVADIARRAGLGAPQLAALAGSPCEEPADGLGDRDGLVEHRVRISGLHCPSCAWLVEHTLRARPGVVSARVDFLSEVGAVELDLRLTSREDALASIEPLGYRAVPLEGAAAPDPERLGLRAAVAGVASMNTMMLAWVHYAELVGLSAGPWKALLGGVGAAIAVPAVAYAGAPIFRRALGLAVRGRMAMETLLALGILASVLLSLSAFVLPGANFYFEVPTMIVLAALCSRLVDGAIRRSGARVLARLLKPSPVWVHLAGPGGAVAGLARVASLEPGDRILVRAGGEAPADLQVEGESVVVSEAVLTGEPAPVPKGHGATVLSGSVVVDGRLRGLVLRRPSESAHAEVFGQVLAVLRGQGERLARADRIASRFVVAVLGSAVLTALVHGLLLGRGGAGALLPAIAVLVVACPCAFSIAASTATGSAVLRLLRDGVLVRDPAALEAAAAVDTVVFDKTGTLTRGDMRVRELRWLGPERPWLLEAVAGLEASAAHPAAAAIRDHLGRLGVRAAPTEAVEEVPGLGVRGRSAGRRVAVGSPAMFDDPALGPAEAGPRCGSRVVFGEGDGAAGVFLLDDPLRQGAAEAVAELGRLGLEVEVLSGDEPQAVARVASAVGIQRHRGRALPGDKAAHLARLRSEGRRVAFVGDGLNDAPALAAAEVGIGLRHGASMALEASGLLSLRDDPAAAGLVIALARRLSRVTTENYLWSFGYNVVLVPVAAAGFLHPALAALAMTASSFTVLANSARLLRVRGPAALRRPAEARSGGLDEVARPRTDRRRAA